MFRLCNVILKEQKRNSTNHSLTLQTTNYFGKAKWRGGAFVIVEDLYVRMYLRTYQLSTGCVKLIQSMRYE